MISVILPVYNGEEYIKETINSILNQTITDLELIIVNDGSTDDTEKLVQSFHDHRVKYMKQINKGVGAAKNEGLKHCSGDFITFHDADDLSLPNRFERLLEGFQGDIGFVHSDMLLINEHHQPVGYWQSGTIDRKHVFSFFINVGTPFNNGTILYKKEVLQHHTFNHYEVGEDTAFVMQLATKVPSYHINEPLYLYRRHTSNSTKSIDYEQLAEHVRGILQNSSYKELMPEINWKNEEKEKNELKALLMISEAFCKRGLIPEGVKLFEESIPYVKDDWDLTFFEGMKALFEKRYESAKQIFLEFNHKDHIIENYLGEAYLALKDYDNAYKHFVNALHQNPNYSAPLQNLKAIGQLSSHHLIDQYKRKFI